MNEAYWDNEITSNCIDDAKRGVSGRRIPSFFVSNSFKSSSEAQIGRLVTTRNKQIYLKSNLSSIWFKLFELISNLREISRVRDPKILHRYQEIVRNWGWEGGVYINIAPLCKLTGIRSSPFSGNDLSIDRHKWHVSSMLYRGDNGRRG